MRWKEVGWMEDSGGEERRGEEGSLPSVLSSFCTYLLFLLPRRRICQSLALLRLRSRYADVSVT